MVIWLYTNILIYDPSPRPHQTRVNALNVLYMTMALINPSDWVVSFEIPVSCMRIDPVREREKKKKGV